MTRAEVAARIRALGVIPVVRAPSSEAARGMVESLRDGGLPIAEITLTVPGAVQLIAQLARELGDGVLLGAGSVADAAGAHACIAAGARFVVSPCFDERVVAACQAAGIAVLPGALTPTEILRAARAGGDFVKVFPASAVGGPDYIRAIRGPLPQAELVPTGGVTLASVAAYFRAGAAAVGAGSELTGASDVAAAARAWVAAVHAARTA
jgi:2-dehydro-3-deoxyphosphogluconate aldolase / (4S)-4-hydroxy-2-oxoglutarate aldolase